MLEQIKLDKLLLKDVKKNYIGSYGYETYYQFFITINKQEYEILESYHEQLKTSKYFINK